MLYLHVTDNLANTNINSVFTHVVTSSLSQKHKFLTKNGKASFDTQRDINWKLGISQRDVQFVLKIF